MNLNDTPKIRDWTHEEWRQSRQDMTRFAIKELHALALKKDCWEIPLTEAVEIAFAILASGTQSPDGEVDQDVRTIVAQMQQDYLSVIQGRHPDQTVRRRVTSILRRLSN